METPLSITKLNDFIFCPVSIYFHGLDEDTEKLTYQCEDQIQGTNSHKNSDNGLYSDKRSILQGISVFSERYNLVGKIDVFDIETGVLTERKRLIKNIYDGYVFQLYGQYFALEEMGYRVNKLRLYSMIDNKSYYLDLPCNDRKMLEKFENTLDSVRSFQFETFKQENLLKCKRCIYYPLCSFSMLTEEQEC